jgi:acyl-CoA thioesterase FadM
MTEWKETYRGVVAAWECDAFAHLTIAYYFARLEDASVAVLDDVPGGDASRTGGLYVRLMKEFRAADLMHVMSAPIALEPSDSGGETLTIGHKIFDSASGELTTTTEQRVALAELSSKDRAALAGRIAAWDGPPREARPAPTDDTGFVPSGQRVVQPWEIGNDGELSWQHLIHHFSGAGLHACRAAGMTPKYLRDNRRGYSTFELDVTIDALPHAGDRIAVRSGIMQVGKSSIRFLHRMIDARTGKRLASMGQFGVHFDLEARRPAPLPDALREAANALVPPAMR